MSMIDWHNTDTVLLDMDGTLLDLHYDNHFWRVHVPQRYSEKHGISMEAAVAELVPRFKQAEGSLEWYCVDYWSEQLGLDIPMLKQEIEHLIAVHPHVVEFLAHMHTTSKRVILVTNAHGKSLNIKMQRTRLAGYFDAIVCSHELNLPKEAPGFWEKFQALEPFERSRTLLVDDSLPVLRAAHDYGIEQLLAVSKPDSRQPQREVSEFPAINSFAELIPEKNS